MKLWKTKAEIQEAGSGFLGLAVKEMQQTRFTTRFAWAPKLVRCEYSQMKILKSALSLQAFVPQTRLQVADFLHYLQI